jgi:hypothetical protein
MVLSGRLPLKVSMLNFDLGPFFGCVSSNRLEVFISENYEKKLLA